jgi:hypothetical protein
VPINNRNIVQIFSLVLIFILQDNLIAIVQADSSNKKTVMGTENKFYFPSYEIKFKSNERLFNQVHDLLNQDKIPDFDPFKTKIDYKILAGMGTAFIGTGLAVHFYQKHAWWSTKRTKFHFQNDWAYALWIDKIGHFYGAIIIQHALSAGLEAANIQSKESTIYGALGAFAFQTFIEIEDGFGPEWGFSPGDFYSDLLGSAYPVAQYYFPYLSNFQFRFSYIPKDLKGTNPVTGQKHIIPDDYEGQKFWLALKMKNILPSSLSGYWPDFLMLSGGMGVKNLDGKGGGNREWYIGLDFDADQIPLYGKFWQFVKNTLNYIHFPLPGIRISPGAKFFVFCF